MTVPRSLFFVVLLLSAVGCGDNSGPTVLTESHPIVAGVENWRKHVATASEAAIAVMTDDKIEHERRLVRDNVGTAIAAAQLEAEKNRQADEEIKRLMWRTSDAAVLKILNLRRDSFKKGTEAAEAVESRFKAWDELKYKDLKAAAEAMVPHAQRAEVIRAEVDKLRAEAQSLEDAYRAAKR